MPPAMPPIHASPNPTTAIEPEATGAMRVLKTRASVSRMSDSPAR